MNGIRNLGDSTARIARGLAALTVLAGVVAGVPWLLWQLAGWPLPDHVPTWTQVQTVLARPMDDQFLLALLACVAWAAWAGFTLETLAATVIAVADLRAQPTQGGVLPGLDRRTRHGPPLGRVTAGLVSAVILTIAVARPTPTRLAMTPAVATLAARIAPTPADAVATLPTAPSPSAAPSGWREYTVPAPHHGIHDSLWRIADNELGDPRRWTQIYRLNVGRPQPDGQQLRDPDLIYPGWVLRLPTDRPAAPPHQAQAVPPTPAAPALPAAPPLTTAPATTASPRPSPASPATTSSARTGSATTGSASAGRPPSAAGPTVTTPTTATPASAPAGPDGLDLPSGGYVGLALAASVSAALAMARARRRRHDRLDGPLSFRLPLPAPAGEPPPPVVQLLHRAHLAATHPAPTQDDDTDLDDADGDSDLDRSAPTDPGPGAPARPVLLFPSPIPAHPVPISPGGADPTTAASATGDRSTHGAADGHGAALAVGTSHGRPVLLRPAAAGGLGLTGPGSHGVARAVLTTVLTAHPGPAGRTRVLVPVADLERVLGSEGVPQDVPGLVLVADLDAALDRLEAHALAVARVRADRSHPATTAGELTILVATPTPHAAHRLQAILAASPSVVAAVLLDAWPAGLTCHLDPDATITAVYPAARPPTSTAESGVGACAQEVDGPGAPVVLPDDARQAVGARLFHLACADALDILRLLADHSAPHQGPPPPPESRRPQPPPGPSTRPSPAPAPALGTPSPADEPVASGTPAAAASAPTAGATPPAAAGPAAPAGAQRQVQFAPRPPTAAVAQVRPWTAPVQVDLLGPPRLRVEGVESGRGVRAKSFELLALLALHPDGAPGETIGDALWPDADTETARASLHGTLKRLRATLRGQTGARDAMFVVNASHRYRLDPRLVGSDLWAFQTACQLVEAATDPDRQLQAMREAAGLYRGALLDGAGYAWAEPDRASLHRLALQVLVRLATTLETSDPEAALATLERTLALDSHNETLYQRAMRLQAALGRPEAIPATLDLLRRHLTDLDVEPGPETLALAQALQHQTHRRASA